VFILPVNRDWPPAKTPLFTCALVAVNSLVWLGLTVSGKNADIVQRFGLHSSHWTTVSLFTHMFLHAGFWHVAGNMFFLWMFAPRLEERMGSWFFAFAYFASGFGAASLQTLFTPGSTIPMVGASGAISGVAGMYFVLFPRSPFDLQLYLGWWHVKTFNALTRGAVGTWIGEQFVLGLITSVTHSFGIAFWAHVGGFISGFIIAALIALKSNKAEQEAILRPKPYTQEERDELFADREEQPSELTSLNLSGKISRNPDQNTIRNA
jgi:membrane associated rhomboid family serine protease